MLQPKRTKYRKQFKGNNAGLALRGNSVAFGDFGLKATDRARMTAREIEAARRAMARYVKRGGQIWIRVFPDVPITKKPLEVRMGSGKGNVEYWIAKVKPGKVLFEMEGVTEADRARGLPSRGRQAVGIHHVREAAGALMKASELRKKSAAELQNELLSLRKEQFALRLQRATGQSRQARPVRQGAQEHCAREDRAAQQRRSGAGGKA